MVKKTCSGVNIHQDSGLVSGKGPDYKSFIRTVQNFPEPGVSFKDITPLLRDSQMFMWAIDETAMSIPRQNFSAIVGIETRGFIIGGALAMPLKCGFIPVRKEGKLPSQKKSANYNLEYGNNTIERHEDAIVKGQPFLLVDDVLATGGTARATVDLINCMQGHILGAAFLVEITEFNGRSNLTIPVYSLIKC
ncbi:MAG: adenine phosphoribosyltransferase [Chloroflexi bacterium]|nr:adenine phosphoribosyltransferase [Chloroflexota bacterium]